MSVTSSTASASPFANRPLFGVTGRGTRLATLVLIYSGAIVAAHWAGYLIRFEFHPDAMRHAEFWRTISWSLGVELVLLAIFGQFRSLLSYFSLPDARRIVYACGTSGLVSLGVWYGTMGRYAPPRSIILVSVILDIAALGGIRLAGRMLRERQWTAGANGRMLRRVIIIGAGDVGANLAKEMMLRRDLCMRPIAFFDDDRSKWNSYLHGIPVVGPIELLAQKKIRADEAVIAMPSASRFRVREVIRVLNDAKIKSEIVPSLEQMVNGSVRISQIRPVQIEDLLGRDRIGLETERIRELLTGKVVMVTGAGGSIGSELCLQIADKKPARLLLVERCEVQMFSIEQKLVEAGCSAMILPLVADVVSEERMRSIFEHFRPQVVFHAAAHKHVPLMEHQPLEAFHNNVLGTKNLAMLSAEFGVDRFVLVSTDKAINPTNTMGATKRLAELYILAVQGQHGAKTRFIAVRFGNVLGSSGSVIPTFKRQIDAGGPVTVTDPEISRYFMTVQEAVGLVLQSAAQGQGGEIFVLDMGKPIKIVDLAHQLIELSGLKAGVDIEIRFTGLRPGEKLFEEITHNTENLLLTEHPKIMRFVGEALPLDSLDTSFAGLQARGVTMDSNQVKLELQKLVPEYQPYFDSSTSLLGTPATWRTLPRRLDRTQSTRNGHSQDLPAAQT